MESGGSWEENQLWCPAVFGEELTSRLNQPNLITTLLPKTKQGNLSITASSQRSEVTWPASVTYSEGSGETQRPNPVKWKTNLTGCSLGLLVFFLLSC